MDERRKYNLHWVEELANHRIEEKERTQEIINLIKEIKDVSLSKEELEYVKLAVKREARKEEWHQAVVQKTVASLVFSMIMGTLYAVWQYIKHLLK